MEPAATTDILLWRVGNSGLPRPHLERYRERLAALTPDQVAALDPLVLTSTGTGAGVAKQPDPTTCGSSSLVMARMINRPAYAMYVTSGYQVIDASTDTREPGERFAEEALAMHQLTNRWLARDGSLQLDWPMALGTTPEAIANEMSAAAGSGVFGTRYETDWCFNERRSSSWTKLVDALSAGHAVPIFVGAQSVPRHVVLAVAGTDDAVTCYEPGHARLVRASRAEWLDSSFNLGGWNTAKALILPR